MISLSKDSVKLFYRVGDPVIDWISLEKQNSGKLPPVMDYEYKILKNTSGSIYGGKEIVEGLIREAQNKFTALADQDPAELFLKVIENISKDRKPFNPDKLVPFEKFCHMRVKYAIQSICDDIIKKGVRTVEFVSESDKDSEDDFQPTTEYQLYKLGKLSEIELELDPLEARELLIEALRSLNIFEKNSLNSSQTSVSSILLMQAKLAMAEFGAGDVQNINVSLGLDKGQNIKNSIPKKLEADRLGPKIYHNAIINLFRACQALQIPLTELRPEFTSDKYIRALTLALEHHKTVCVTEYDYPLLPTFLPKEDVNLKLLINALDNKEYVRSINSSILEEVNRIKITQLRNINSVANKVKSYYYEWTSEQPKIDTRTRDGKDKSDYDIKEELLNKTTLMNIGRKTAQKTIVESEEYGGPLSPTALKIMQSSVSKYLTDMEIYHPDKYEELRAMIDEILDTNKHLSVAKNGFLIERETGNYFHAKLPEGVYFINISGYLVKNYIDFNFYRDNIKGFTPIKGNIGAKNEKFVYRESPDTKDFSVLEVYDPMDMSLIFKGDKDSWRELQ